MKRLDGKVAFVTGAAGLIGPHIVRRLTEDGATVIAADILVSDQLLQLVDEIRASGGQCAAQKMDITASNEISAVFASVEKQYGHIDILVNNAGKLRRGSGEPFQKADEEFWKNVIEVNLVGTMLCTQKILPGMIERKQGKIINLASIAGVSGLPGWADYSAAKAGIILFSQTLAMEVGKYGITVNCVSPGMIAGAPRSSSGTWLGRCGLGSEVANMIAFLASSEADYITGCNYLVDGGRVLGPKGSNWDL